MNAVVRVADLGTRSSTCDRLGLQWFAGAPKIHLMAQRNRSGTLNCLSFVVLRGRDHNRLACAETTLGNGTSGEFHLARNGKDSLLDDSTQAPMPACASVTDLFHLQCLRCQLAYGISGVCSARRPGRRAADRAKYVRAESCTELFPTGVAFTAAAAKATAAKATATAESFRKRSASPGKTGSAI